MCGEAGTCIVFGVGAPTVASFKPLQYRVYYDTAAGNKAYIGTGTAWSAVTANAPAGSGDVIGPAGAVNNDFAQYDGITGKLIKDGGFAPASFDTAGAAAAAQAAAIAASDPAGSAAAALVAAEAYTDAALVPPAPNVQAASYIFVLADAGLNAYVQFTGAGAQAATIPPGVFPVGAVLTWEQAGAGVVTATAGIGVTLNARGGLVATNGQFAVMGAKQTAANVWTLFGDRA